MASRKKPPAPSLAALARAFEKFALAGYPQTKFTEPLYQALSRSFGFIAHFDRTGFYIERFANFEGRVETLQTMMAKTPWTERPTELALRAVVEKHGLATRAVADAHAALEKRERTELARLQAKYG
jgi:hypothetical protein